MELTVTVTSLGPIAKSSFNEYNQQVFENINLILIIVKKKKLWAVRICLIGY